MLYTMFPSTMIAASAAYFFGIAIADSYTADGNTQMTIGTSSEAVVYYGDVSPWTVIDSLNQNCGAGTCNSSPWTFSTDLGNTAANDNSPSNITPGTITVTALDATFESDADMAGMIEALQDLANQTQISQTWTEYYCAGDPAGDDPSPNYKKSRAVFDMARVKRRDELIESRQICCNCEENGTPFEQYSSAATWYIRLNNDDGSLRSELRLGVTAGAIADAASQTICTDLFTAGAAVAGAMTGGAAAAAGMTLAGLFCGLIPTS